MIEPAAIPAEIEAIARTVLDGAFAVHRALGPGLLESAYEACLAHDLGRRGMTIARQVNVPVSYEGLQLDAGFRLDLLAADAVIVEVKAVERFTPLHTAQVMTYLKLTGKRLGLLINFNTPLLRDGIKRVVL